MILAILLGSLIIFVTLTIFVCTCLCFAQCLKTLDYKTLLSDTMKGTWMMIKILFLFAITFYLVMKIFQSFYLADPESWGHTKVR